MQPVIRAARRSELAEVYELLEHAFPEAGRSLFVAQTEHDATFRQRHGRVAMLDGRVAGYVRIFARTTLVQGAPVAAGGVGSVATAPHARARGIATALLRDALRQMRRDGMRLSFLFTGIMPFYQRLGFRAVTQPYFEAVPRDAARTAAPGYDVHPIATGDLRVLLSIHRRAIAGTTGAVVRTTAAWRDASHWLAEDPSGCLVASRAGRVCAYIRSRRREYG